MKQEDFFKIMDCASEEDIADMMRYHRSRLVPDREEEIVMTKYTERAESESRHGKGIAAAVAAVLVCANIAGGAYLLNSGKQPEQSAGASVQSAPIEEVTEAVQGIEAVQTETVTTEAVKPAELPQYVQLMQEYYTNLNGQPCTYDFTGLGQDYNLVYEYPDYTLTFKSMVGCDWIVYYFYDIKPEDTSETNYLSWNRKEGRASAGDLFAFKDGKVNFYFVCDKTAPLNGRQDYALDDGVWHMVGTTINSSDKPFFSGENSGIQIGFDVGKMKEGKNVEPFTFEAKELPLHETASPEIALYEPAIDEENREFAEEWLASIRKWTNAHPLTRCAETPFGTYYVSDLYTDGIEHGNSAGIPMNWLSINGKPFGTGSRANLDERGGAAMNEEPSGYVSLFDAVTQP